ncbi:MAG: hypothetical protein JO022_06925 [Acidobacteriaceae bacterium]|nr:hypothetical protein [Acidobacteriaceae bacterium]
MNAGLLCAAAFTQEPSAPAEPPKTEPEYQNTFSGPIVELTAEKVTVSRSILGKPAEKRTFLIKPETKIEGKLKVKMKVTVGFVTTDDGDVARLIVVRPANKK